MIRLPPYFHQFTGLHTLLTGLMPFFIPVILWRETASLAMVSGFISLSGAGFLASLMVWEKLRTSADPKLVLVVSFAAEALLIFTLVAENVNTGLTIPGILALALLNGIYGCFYWLSLRALFVRPPHRVADRETGNRFGNFQLIVGVLLKVGILAGAFLLEMGQDIWLVAVTLAISAIGVARALSPKHHVEISYALTASPTSFQAVHSFKDNHWSRTVFFVDGLFLFMESYFWVLSLYLLSDQSFAKLGIIVVGLTIILSLLFLVIKSRIDSAPANAVFLTAVCLYALSWVLRGTVNEDTDTTILSAAILCIAFMTSFFRLSFNKLFFDRIQPNQASVIILAKSWFTQAGVTVFFGCLSLFFYFHNDSTSSLTLVYWLFSPLALTYLLFIHKYNSKPARQRPRKDQAQAIDKQAFPGKQQCTK